MDYRYVLSNVLGIVGGVLAQSVTNEILDSILMVMSILSIMVSLVLSVITWIRNSKADKEITPEEMEELNDILIKTKNRLEDIKKGEDKDGNHDNH